jgi:hypothetical protein
MVVYCDNIFFVISQGLDAVMNHETSARITTTTTISVKKTEIGVRVIRIILVIAIICCVLGIGILVIVCRSNQPKPYREVDRESPNSYSSVDDPMVTPSDPSSVPYMED